MKHSQSVGLPSKTLSLNKTNSLTILVSSCDKYSACWQPFLHGVNKYWPDHPRIIFITNRQKPEGADSIQIDPDRGWTDNLIAALEQVDSPYILYAQEDYWITQAVNIQAIADYLQLLEDQQVDYIRLHPTPPPDLEFPGDARLGLISTRAKYRTSLQMALWRKSALRAVLLEGESPWAFEVQSSQRSASMPYTFASVRTKEDGIDYTFTAVVDGEWSAAAYRYAQAEDFQVDFGGLAQKPLFKKLRDRTRRNLYRLKRKIERALSRGN